MDPSIADRFEGMYELTGFSVASFLRTLTMPQRSAFFEYKKQRLAGASQEEATVAAARLLGPLAVVRSASAAAAVSASAPVEAPRQTVSAPMRLGRAPAERHYFMADGEFEQTEGPSDYDLGNGSTFGALIAAGLSGTRLLSAEGAHGTVYMYDAGGKSFIIKKIMDDKQSQVREINMLGKAQKTGYAMKLLAAQTGEDGTPGYILSDYVPGLTLFEWINANHGTAEFSRRIKDLLNQVVDGLQAIHADGVEIIHRDIKPENIWVPAEGHIFFLDFGSATRTGTPSLYLGSNTYARDNNISKIRVADVINNYYALGSIIGKTLAGNNDGLSEFYTNRRRTKANGTRKFATAGGKRKTPKKKRSRK